MFSSSHFFATVPCPHVQSCKRVYCQYSHLNDTGHPNIPAIPIDIPPVTSDISVDPSHSKASGPSVNQQLVPLKRSTASTLSHTASKNAQQLEPPSKFQKLSALSKKPSTSLASSLSVNDAPTLNINAAQSQVPIPVRQAMLKIIYEHFKQLYSDILAIQPNLPSEHALSQEQDIYSGSTKHTYRNAVISSVAALKKRQKPNSVFHDSVGTDRTLKHRKEQRLLLRNMKLTKEKLIPYIMSHEMLEKMEYVTKIPEGSGRGQPSDEGKVNVCERCKKQFIVKRRDDAEECVFHWGRPYTSRVNGERVRVYNCCSRPISESEGCDRGPHVFYENDRDKLHTRHSFSESRRPLALEDANTVDTALDVLALDCEMVYTTGGMSIARVSVVDGAGEAILDEYVRLDDGVEVIDFNTRFSGITHDSYSKAVLNLEGIRRSLDAFINSDTIIIGHALENDLKALRMIHFRCVDTAVLFPHPSGHPYRKALRDLARQHLNEIIQAGGGTVGHSSMEDTLATLNLVRKYISDRQK